MGVQNLWKLLEPCGRRVDVQTLEHKTLAIDASIWLTQFVKAMRDDDGNPIRNAHVIGTLRRVAKLLFHGAGRRRHLLDARRGVRFRGVTTVEARH